MSTQKLDPKVLIERACKRLKVLSEKGFYGTIEIQMVAGAVVLVHEDRTWKPENGDFDEVAQAAPHQEEDGSRREGKPRP